MVDLEIQKSQACEKGRVVWPEILSVVASSRLGRSIIAMKALERRASTRTSRAQHAQCKRAKNTRIKGYTDPHDELALIASTLKF